MANGKGWLDCGDCKYSEFSNDDYTSRCSKHKCGLVSPVEIDHKHRFCTEFVAKSEHLSVLNNEIRKEGPSSYFYLYKADKKTLESGNERIQLEAGILYGYHYHGPHSATKICALGKDQSR